MCCQLLPFLRWRYLSFLDLSGFHPFTYVTAGEPFIAHSWLAELAFYLLERAAGTVGFVVLRFALISLPLGFAFRTAQMMGATVHPLLMAYAKVQSELGTMEGQGLVWASRFLVLMHNPLVRTLIGDPR